MVAAAKSYLRMSAFKQSRRFFVFPKANLIYAFLDCAVIAHFYFVTGNYNVINNFRGFVYFSVLSLIEVGWKQLKIEAVLS